VPDNPVFHSPLPPRHGDQNAQPAIASTCSRGTPVSGKKSVNQWFNPAAFARAHAYIGAIRPEHTSRAAMKSIWDSAAREEFPTHKSRHLLFRVEFFKHVILPSSDSPTNRRGDEFTLSLSFLRFQRQDRKDQRSASHEHHNRPFGEKERLLRFAQSILNHSRPNHSRQRRTPDFRKCVDFRCPLTRPAGSHPSGLDGYGECTGSPN